MATRLEFLSRAWLDLLFARINEQIGSGGDGLAGVEFALCETVTGVPSHLRHDGGELSWWLAVSGATATTGLGARNGVDYSARASYAEARELARRIYPVRARGPAPSAGPIPPALETFFVELHNYLAARTI